VGGFERVSYPDGNGVRRRVLLKDVRDTGRAIIGMEVDREGDLVEPSAADLREAGAETGTRQHVILYAPGDKIVRTPLVEDWLTGRLVTDGKADQQRNPARYGR
jgi:hypothetical protein